MTLASSQLLLFSLALNLKLNPICLTPPMSGRQISCGGEASIFRGPVHSMGMLYGLFLHY